MPKNNILFLTGDLGKGGQERQLFYLLQNLDKEKFNVHLVIWDFSPDDYFYQRLNQNGITIHKNLPGQRSILKYIRTFLLAIRLQPTVIHSYAFYLNFLAGVSSKITFKSKSIGALRTVLNSLEGIYSQKFIKLQLRFLDVLLANNNQVIKELKSSQFRFDSDEKYEVITNCLDLDEFKVGANKPLVFTSVSIGRFVPGKRFDLLLQALAKLKAAGVIFKHLLVGWGELESELKKLIIELDLENFVSIPADSNDVVRHLGASHIFIQSSTFEGTPNVVMEAMSSGLPIIATSVGDTARLVIQGSNGFLIPPNDENAIVEAYQLLYKDSRIRNEMGDQSRKMAESSFSINQFVDANEQLYLKLSQH